MSKPPAPSDLADKFMLRMPEGLRERIKAAADTSNRSMNAEIVSTLLEKYPEPPNVEAMLQHLKSLTEDLRASPTDENFRDFYTAARKLYEAMKVRQEALGDFLKPYRDQGLLPPDEDDADA